MTTITSRYFNQHTSKVQKAAEPAPVIITRRGEPSHVLMSIADFRRLTGEAVPDAAKKARNAYEYLTPSNPAVADTELEIPPRSKAQRQPVNFTED